MTPKVRRKEIIIGNKELYVDFEIHEYFGLGAAVSVNRYYEFIAHRVMFGMFFQFIYFSIHLEIWSNK